MGEKKVNIIVPLCITLSILYIILAAKPLSKEIHFIFRWTTDCGRISPEVQSKQTAEVIPFRLGQTAGYFTEDGIITNVFTFPYKLAISKNEYALYAPHGQPIQIFLCDGKPSGKISREGFPFFQDSRKYLMLPGGNSFSVLNDDGSENWSFENYVPITAFSSSKAGIIAGFADGSVLTFDEKGTVTQKYSPGGSKFQIILGAAISASGNLTACVSGQNEQRFILARKDSGITTIIFHEYLEKQTSNQVPVIFSEDESKCFFAHKDCLGILDCRTLKSSHIPIKGTILAIELTQNDGSVFVLSKDEGLYTVSVIEKFDKYAGNFNFKADNAFITVRNDSLFVGKDSSISRIDIVHK